jgi:hypothetical protein
LPFFAAIPKFNGIHLQIWLLLTLQAVELPLSLLCYGQANPVFNFRFVQVIVVFSRNLAPFVLVCRVGFLWRFKIAIFLCPDKPKQSSAFNPA